MQVDCLAPSLQERLKITEADSAQMRAQMARHKSRELVPAPPAKDAASFYSSLFGRSADRKQRRCSARGTVPIQQTITGLCRELTAFRGIYFGGLAKTTVAPKQEKHSQGTKTPPPKIEINAIVEFYELCKKKLPIMYLTMLEDPDLGFLSSSNSFLIASAHVQRQTLSDLEAGGMSERHLRYLRKISDTLDQYLKLFLHPKKTDPSRYAMVNAASSSGTKAFYDAYDQATALATDAAIKAYAEIARTYPRLLDEIRMALRHMEKRMNLDLRSEMQGLITPVAKPPRKANGQTYFERNQA